VRTMVCRASGVRVVVIASQGIFSFSDETAHVDRSL
jgi:hypothetical protein